MCAVQVYTVGGAVASDLLDGMMVFCSLQHPAHPRNNGVTDLTWLVFCAGTGKTAYVKRHLQSGLGTSFTNTMMTFSAQTSANMTQDIIDGRLERRKRGLFGPPAGKRMVIFVDDLNMPQV